jgi:host factor-I protein
MASDRPQALQDTFLDHVRKHEVPVTIFLASGIKLQGSVREFDSYSLLLVRDRQAKLIYKDAVSTIMPGEPVRMPQTSDDQGAFQDLGSRPE